MENIDLSQIKVEDLQLIHFADPIMKTRPPAFDFEKDGEHAVHLAETLYKKMLELGGVGLSANQVGLAYRMFVVGGQDFYKAIFNPLVLGVNKDEDLMEEGCLSFPGFFLTLRRPKSVLLQFQDEKGETHSGTFEGVGARIILHEYDHMEGINFTNHASTFKLKHELNKWKKKQQKLLRKLKNGR